MTAVDPTTDTFAQAFQSMMDHPPMPWQRRLFGRMLSDDWPEALDIPTGLGKTSVMAIWLLALASGAPVPRRLVYVVNRRTIVDQATAVAEDLRRRLCNAKAGTPAAHVREQLCQLANAPANKKDTPEFLAISTLRGQAADNEQWIANPAQAAIVVGTVDMIGSRLLFRAYRSSWRQRSRLAGLVGHDALIVHDEAHLSRPFQRLLEWVRSRQATHAGSAPPHRPVRVLSMSATDRRENGTCLYLDGCDFTHDVVVERIHAVKQLQLHPTERRRQISRMVELATAHEAKPCRVIVFVQRPDTAAQVAESIAKVIGDDQRVALLTGTIRGFERDMLVHSPAVKWLLGGAAYHKTHYLVSTSAGEVGADFDADHLVCDQTTLDSLIQRLGRVNRRGGKAATVHLVCDASPPAKPKPFEDAARATVEVLRRMPQGRDGCVDVSPMAMRNLVDSLKAEERAACNLPEPVWTEPHDAVLDAWSLTSIVERWPLAHDLTGYLHGMIDAEPPETTVVWRAELELFRLHAGDERHDLIRTQIEQMLDAHPVRTHEALRVSDIGSIIALLKRVQEKAEDDERNQCFVVIGDEWKVVRLGDFNADTAERDLRGCTVVLPPSFGGLCKGMLNPDFAKERVRDVADEPEYAHRRRILLRQDEDESWRAYDILANPSDGTVHDSRRDAVASILDRPRKEEDIVRIREEFTLATSEDGEPTTVLLIVNEYAPSSRSVRAIELAEHTRDVVTHTDRIVRALLPPSFHEVYRLAAQWHDLGKDDPIWQAAVHNSGYPDQVWAKSGKRGMNVRVLKGYRHEYASLLRAATMAEMNELGPDEQDLLLHLIATHHGRGRPYFSPTAMAHAGTENAKLDERVQPAAVARRFDRLQRRFGHWGLAWLEALFMAADAAGSADAVEEEQ